MRYDLVIRNGTVIDGTGAPRRQADVAISGSRIAAVGEIDGNGREEIDAEGHIVAPGFVDAHTHMDAQVFWDDLGTSSCWHGVTSVVMGNCGFSLAPARFEDRGLVVRNLERAEDISGEAMEQGITWTWATFAEYLDAVAGVPKGLNYAASVGHSALRTWAMGERAFSEPATDRDLEVMKRELRDALRAGAVGFTTSMSDQHATSDDRPVASRLATWEEICELVGVVSQESEGVFEIAPKPESVFGNDGSLPPLQELAVASGVPIVFGLFSMPGMPSLEPMIEETFERGGQMYGLTHCRGVTALQSFQTQLAFDVLPEWQELRRKPLDAQRGALRDPALRKRLVHAAHHGDYGNPIGAEARKPDFDTLEVLTSVYMDQNPKVGDLARERGVDPVELMIDLALEHDFRVFFSSNFTPQLDEDLLRLLRNPHTAMSFSDSGAHVSQIIDASIQTHLLAYWVRERQALTLEEAIPMITRRPAEIWRLHDRGLLQRGFAADVTIFDPETVAPEMPQVAHDLPGGARRLVQTARGYKATLVNGRTLTRDGKATHARPGELLRGGQLPTPSR